MGFAGGAGSGSGGGSSSSGRTTTGTAWDGAGDATNRNELRLTLPSSKSNDLKVSCKENLRMMESPLKGMKDSASRMKDDDAKMAARRATVCTNSCEVQFVNAPVPSIATQRGSAEEGF